jgi:hypothetical protein
MELHYKHTKKLVADLFTKALTGDQHLNLSKAMGVGPSCLEVKESAE